MIRYFLQTEMPEQVGRRECRSWSPEKGLLLLQTIPTAKASTARHIIKSWIQIRAHLRLDSKDLALPESLTLYQVTLLTSQEVLSNDQRLKEEQAVGLTKLAPEYFVRPTLSSKTVGAGAGATIEAAGKDGRSPPASGSACSQVTVPRTTCQSDGALIKGASHGRIDGTTSGGKTYPRESNSGFGEFYVKGFFTNSRAQRMRVATESKIPTDPDSRLSTSGNREQLLRIQQCVEMAAQYLIAPGDKRNNQHINKGSSRQDRRSNTFPKSPQHVRRPSFSMNGQPSNIRARQHSLVNHKFTGGSSRTSRRRSHRSHNTGRDFNSTAPFFASPKRKQLTSGFLRSAPELRDIEAYGRSRRAKRSDRNLNRINYSSNETYSIYPTQ
ncbi:hypothetical protein R1sor_013247 [Riccia sorocarpa]|uniref:Uncharacterized protein n=1 Tax=Riccia sorocarpa TaxID=122646 RepID=A0ABD3H659_9MARC